MINPKEKKNLLELLSEPKKIAIIPHKNPDGDAIGSALAMLQMMKKLGHQAEVISPNDFPKSLKWLPCSNEVYNAEFNAEGAKMGIKKADVIFLLDFNTLPRIEGLSEIVESSKAFKVLIDHHEQPDLFDFNMSNTQIPATCELIYHFFEEMNWLHHLDKEICTCLLTGIITDTGVFRYSSVQSSTLFVASKLMEFGAEPYQIQNQLFDNRTAESLGLLATFLNNMQVFPEYRTVIFKLNKEELNQHNFQKGDTEGFVNYGLSIDNYVFSVYFADDTQKDFVKISFRSKGNFDVNLFARKHFNGGGHQNAAGGRSDINLEETIKEFVNLLPLYKEQLQNTII